MPTWKRIGVPQAGYLYDLSESLAILDWRHPTVLEEVSGGSMIIVSDYSGQHKNASHEAHSFLVTTDRSIREWLPLRQQFRNRWLPDCRHISFKQLREPVRWRALRPFLNCISNIRGNVFTFLVDRRITSFMEGGSDSIREAFPDCFSVKTPPKTVEKMFRLSSFIALLTAGLRSEWQEALWISDHDETLETFDRREQIGRLCGYLTFGFTRWSNPAQMSFGTTEHSGLPEWAEDTATIPDLIAGTCCQLSSALPTYCGKESWLRVVSLDPDLDKRARVLGSWMATSQGQLRHILLRLELGIDGTPHSSAQAFTGFLP